MQIIASNNYIYHILIISKAALYVMAISRNAPTADKWTTIKDVSHT